MKTISTIYKGKNELIAFCKNNAINPTDNILLQVFTGVLDGEYITNLIETLVDILPNVQIIGSTTDGEIISGEVCFHSTVLSFSVFENTQVQTFSVADDPLESSSFVAGQNLIKEMGDTSDAKVAIIFKEGVNINGELFLDAFNEFAPHLKVAGGIAGDNATFKGGYVFTHKGLHSAGSVAAVLSGDDLVVNTAVNFGWERIGKAFKITKASENTIYRIDDMPAVEFYNRYLGAKISEQMPMTGAEFPLIVNRGGIAVARSVITKNDNGSFTFAGNFKEGEEVYLGYGNIDEILNGQHLILDALSQNPVESIFAYSCMARRRFLKEGISLEVQPLKQIAPVSGFFTYGEFYRQSLSHPNSLLNQAMTLLILSESSKVPKTSIKNIKGGFSQHIQTIKAFTHLINTTTKELNDSKKEMQKHIDLIDENIIISAFDLKGIRTYVSNAFCKISGFSKEGLIGLPHSNTKPSDFNLKEFNTTLSSLKQGETWQGEIKNQKNDGDYFWLDSTVTPNTDEQGNITGYTAISQDITHKKILEILSITDALTDTFNRRQFKSVFPQAIAEAKQANHHLVFMMIDIDNFKQYNDEYGHQAGDEVLIRVASCLKDALSTVNGHCFRMGGEEFAGIFEVDTPANSIELANAFKQCVESMKIEHKKNAISLYVTVSIGVVCQPANKVSEDELYRQADELLYQAKEKGRNQVVSKIIK